MKNINFAITIIAIALFSCNADKDKHRSGTKTDTAQTVKVAAAGDSVEIRTLIRRMLNWSESKNSIELIPVLTGPGDSICIGMDLQKLKIATEKLKATGFFSQSFIDNYSAIITTLDKKIRNHEFEKWNVGDLPTFSFANDVNPYCLCQDVPYDKPNAWDQVQIKAVKLDDAKGELYWTWGKLELNTSPDWKDFKYKFGVEKENGKWKISYLEGFDFKNATRKDGI